MADVCQKKDMRDNIYLNFDQMPYRKSSAWQRLTSDHPNLIANKIVEYPRYLFIGGNAEQTQWLISDPIK